MSSTGNSIVNDQSYDGILSMVSVSTLENKISSNVLSTFSISFHTAFLDSLQRVRPIRPSMSNFLFGSQIISMGLSSFAKAFMLGHGFKSLLFVQKLDSVFPSCFSLVGSIIVTGFELNCVLIVELFAFFLNYFCILLRIHSGIIQVP